jgi:hypothetical protein
VDNLYHNPGTIFVAFRQAMGGVYSIGWTNTSANVQS